MAHPHITTGEPCHCGWGERLRKRRMRKQASKLDWLRDRKDKFSQTPRGKGALHLLHNEVNRVGQKLDPLTPWIYREIKKGRLNPDLSYPDDEEGGNPDFNHWADWYHSDSPTRRGVDIMQKQIGHPTPGHTNHWADNPQAVQHHINDWNTELQSKMDEDIKQSGDVMHEWPDGWSIRRLAPEHLEDEGDAMGHCVGGYGDDVAAGRTGIYSLRDPKGQPHVTTEIRPNRYEEETNYDPTPRPENGHVIQIQGKADSTPIDEYQDRMKDWFDSFHPVDKPSVPIHEKTFVPIPKDPSDLQHWFEPEPNYDNYLPEEERSLLDSKEASRYGLEGGTEGDPNDEFEYEGDGEPDWHSIVGSFFDDMRSPFKTPGHHYRNDFDPKNVRQIANESGRTDSLEKAVEAHYPTVEEHFYNNHYLSDLPMSPSEQWKAWDRGDFMDQLAGKHMLRNGPQGEPVQDTWGTPAISPEQGAFPMWEPSSAQGPAGTPVGQRPDYHSQQPGKYGLPFPYQDTGRGTRRAPPDGPKWFDVVSSDLSIDDPKRWEPQPNWTPGSEGKGFLLTPHPRFPDLQGSEPIVWTWNTENMRPMHSDVAARAVQETPQGMTPDRSSYFHITPDGGIWTFGTGRKIDGSKLQAIRKANPDHFLAENAPRVSPDPFGHAKSIVDKLGAWEILSDFADLHAEFEVPRNIRQRIRDWVDKLRWPEGASKEDQRNYHITLVSVDEPTEEETEDDTVSDLKAYWEDRADGRRVKFRSNGIDLFGDESGEGAVVLRLESERWKELALDFADQAEAEGLDPRRFPGGPKAHITLGFASEVPEGDDLELSFHSGDFNINTN